MNQRRSEFHLELTTLNGLEVSDAITVGGRSFVPSADLAFLEARCAYGLPVVNAFGQALLPQVIARSVPTWDHKMVNVGHMVKSYAPRDIPRDRIIGHVAGWEFVGGAQPANAEQPWPIPANREEAPHCRLALAIYKSAEMVPGLFGSSQTGRRKWTVSMEVRWGMAQTAFAWKRSLVPVMNALDLGGGWEGVIYDKAPADLRACWDDTAEGGAGAITKPWQKRDVVLLLGGVDFDVEFQGIALVNEGREPTAHIRRLLAGRLDGAIPTETEVEAAQVRAVQDLAGALELAALATRLQP